MAKITAATKAELGLVLPCLLVQHFASRNAQRLNQSLRELESHLTLRTYISGRYKISVANIAVWAAIRGNSIALSSVKKVYCNVSRWYSFIEASNPWITEATKDLTSPEMMERARERAARSAAGSSFDVVGQPQVDGPMKHGGVLIYRFDDINPSNESMDFQNSITEDLALIDIIPDMTSNSSDYFQQMHDLAVQLIKDGKAFADDSELGKGDDSRKNRLPSKHRDMGIEETLAPLTAPYGIPSSTAATSPSTIARVLAVRCFCAPVLDSIEGVTLALRNNEYRDRNAQYEWIQSTLGLRPVLSWDFSRLNFVRTVLSKRKLTRIVNEGKVWDWSDPRMPTIRGIIRRGVTVPVLREFILKQGPSRNILNLEWVHEVPKYVKNTSLGTRKIQTGRTIVIEHGDARSFELGEMITLMNWGNAVVRAISMIPPDAGAEASVSGDVPDFLVKYLVLELDLSSQDFKKTKKITWLAATDDKMISVELMAFDHLITKDKLEPTDVLEECLTPVMQFTTRAFADCNVVDREKGAVI
ncbi:Glutamyl/glutaminyl-tRNA synthetase, class Ib [Penicillium occitanis (nom. inval.)]|nr:Glutamyl/glutaminyl-tRNA synthetase, class Ib [Penicillium occitanis (nom. inval.)]PCG90395.1 hypothetical protein PENOC_102280 [Penicillium occitanis (nom. inval.)]